MSEKKNLHIDKAFNALIKNIAKKDKSALEQFYKIYGRVIYVTAKTVVKSSFKADEVVNDVLLKIWNLKTLGKKIKNPNGWLYLITVNCAKDKIKYEKTYEEIYDIAVSDNQIEKILDEDEFYNDISELNDIEQQILIFRFVSDLTLAQIAKIINKSQGYVSATYYRALDKIKNKMK